MPYATDLMILSNTSFTFPKERAYQGPTVVDLQGYKTQYM